MAPARLVVRGLEWTVPPLDTSKTSMGLDWGDLGAFWTLLGPPKTSMGVDWGDLDLFLGLLDLQLDL